VEDRLDGNIFKEIKGDHVLGCSVKGSILSFRNNSPRIENVVSAYKLKAPRKIVRVKSVTSTLKLTSSHKVLVNDYSGNVWKKANELKIGDYVFSPKKIDINTKNLPKIIECIDDTWIIHLDKKTKKKLIKKLRQKFGTVSDACRKLDISYKRLIHSLEGLYLREIENILEVLNEDIEKFKEKITKFSKKGQFYNLKKKYPDERLMYLLGLIESDGYITSRKNVIHKICFDNTEKELIDIFIEYLKHWVGNSKVSYYNPKKQPSLYRAYTYSRFFTQICQFFGLRTSKEDLTDLRKIFQLPENLIASFIAGYFDGDGSAVIIEDEDRRKPRITLEFSMKEERIAKQIQLLLKRIGIISIVNSSRNNSTFGLKIMHRVRISFADEILDFIEKIPIKHPGKKIKFSRIRSLLLKHKKKQSKLNQASLYCNFLIKKIREENNLKRGELSEPTFLLMIENGKRIQKHTVKRIIKSFIKLGVKSKDVKKLHELISNNFYLDPIKEIKEVEFKDEFVYDFTVQGTHCYIPSGGFLISNCNGCAIECLPLITPKYDVERFGIVLKPSARHADILLVTGPTN